MKLESRTREHTLSQIYPHWNWNYKLNTKLSLEFQFEYGFKLELQVELSIIWENAYIWEMEPGDSSNPSFDLFTHEWKFRQACLYGGWAFVILKSNNLIVMYKIITALIARYQFNIQGIQGIKGLNRWQRWNTDNLPRSYACLQILTYSKIQSLQLFT